HKEMLTFFCRLFSKNLLFISENKTFHFRMNDKRTVAHCSQVCSPSYTLNFRSLFPQNNIAAFFSAGISPGCSGNGKLSFRRFYPFCPIPSPDNYKGTPRQQEVPLLFIMRIVLHTFLPIVRQ